MSNLYDFFELKERILTMIALSTLIAYQIPYLCFSSKLPFRKVMAFFIGRYVDVCPFELKYIKQNFA